LTSYYVRRRDYAPLIGRWISEDPLGFGGGDTNLNRYVGNRATVQGDPSGMAPITCVCVCPQKIWYGRPFQVTTNCVGLGQNCCLTACNTPKPNLSLCHVQNWWINTIVPTPPPPTLWQLWWEMYTSCSKKQCQDDCNAARNDYLALCVAGCAILKPVKTEYLKCLGACSAAVTSTWAACYAACLRCTKP